MCRIIDMTAISKRKPNLNVQIMKRKSGDTFWLALGFIGGFIIAALMGAVLVPLLSTNTFQDYQTFFGALIALLGALLTVWVLRQQIRQAEDLEENRRERRCLASRSVMPVVLSVMADYANECTSRLVNLHRSVQPGQRVNFPSETIGRLFPEIPSAPIPVLRSVIEDASPPIANTIADLLSHMQVTSARLHGLENDLRGRPSFGGLPYRVRQRDIDERLVDVAELHARTVDLFEYARRENDNQPTAISQEKMGNSLRIAGVDNGFPNVERIVASRYPAE